MFRIRGERSELRSTEANRGQQLCLVLFCALSLAGVRGQTLIPGSASSVPGRLPPTDLAILDDHASRGDLHCTVAHTKPELGWDFTFHTAYQAAFPLRDLIGGPNELTILFRVIPQEHVDDAAYMVQKLRVPRLKEDSAGKVDIQGVFTLGEGKYHIDWLARDNQGSVCATSWDLEARLDPKDAPLREWIPQDLVQPVTPLFEEGPAESQESLSQSTVRQNTVKQSTVKQNSDAPLPHVSIIVNFDPPKAWAVVPRKQDIEGLLGILRRIGRDPHIGTYSVIACSLGAQRVVYAQERATKLDLGALATALLSLKLGVVDARDLASANGPGQFATNLIADHLKNEKPDALIFLGRKTAWNDGIPREALQSLPRAPMFYLSYNTEKQISIQQDPISTIVKRVRGFEYSIYRPNDLFKAWTDVVSHISRATESDSIRAGSQTIKTLNPRSDP